MRLKKLINFCLFFALFASFANFVACSTSHMPNGDIPIPSVIFVDPASTETPDYFDTQYNLQPEAPDIPEFNEYNIRLDFDPNARSIHGLGSVRYTNRGDSPQSKLIFDIYLNALGRMNIDHVFWDNEELTFQLRGTRLQVDLPRPLELGETIQVRIQFNTHIPSYQSIWIGSLLSSSGTTRVADYIVEVSTPPGYVVAGTGTKVAGYLDERSVTNFIARGTRDFAFTISSDFELSSRMTATNVEIHLYHYTLNLQVDRILDAAVDAMVIFEETIGAYPYPQLSIIEADILLPFESFSSVIFMNSDHLLTVGGLENLKSAVGSQWFSVIVGSGTAEEVWLNNSLNQLVRLGIPEYLDHSYPNVQNMQNWQMLIQEMGIDNFRYLLRLYYERFAFQVATVDDFIALAEELHGVSLQNIFDEYLNDEGMNLEVTNENSNN